MFGDQKDTQKNLKDSRTDRQISIKDNVLPISYTKTNKLITGLYMVTDILDKDEPIRGKLRTLGAGIISDIYSAKSNQNLSSAVVPKIIEVVSFLDIASAINMISEMNGNILKNEFLKLKDSIGELGQSQNIFAGGATLSEFMEAEEAPAQLLENPKYKSIGRPIPSRIGVQKGSTLMKALSRINMSNNIQTLHSVKDNFDVLKKERRQEIVSIVKTNGGGLTITDIKSKAVGAVASCGEKTLQRELISMVKDGVLKKVGEKRWSRYFTAN